MARDALAEIIGRLANDAAFREAVQVDPLTALADYDLTDDEKRSLATQSRAADTGVHPRGPWLHRIGR